MLRVHGPNPNDVSLGQVFDFLRLRKEWFVDGLHWDLPHIAEKEWDQYDLPDALFAIAYDGARCVGGARIVQTSTQSVDFFGINRSWMIADFAENDAISMSVADLRIELPNDPKVWEMTRFVATSPSVTASILEKVNSYLAEQGAEAVLTLSPKPMVKVLRRLGYSAEIVSSDLCFDGKRFAVIRTEVRCECGV